MSRRPTKHRAGSPEKIEALRRRVEHEEGLKEENRRSIFYAGDTSRPASRRGFAERQRLETGVPADPYNFLLLSLIERAALDIHHAGRYIRDRAVAWVNNPDERVPMGFRWICIELGLPAEDVAAAVFSGPPKRVST